MRETICLLQKTTLLLLDHEDGEMNEMHEKEFEKKITQKHRKAVT